MHCAARLRLGLALFSREVPCPWCNEMMDVYGMHTVACRGRFGAKFRHNVIRDELAVIATAARISHSVEAGYLLSDDRSGQKPADLLLFNWEAGRSVCVDVSVANSVIFMHERRPFVAMEALIAKDRSKYQAACAARDIVLRPFVVGSLGSFSEGSILLMQQLGTALCAVLGLPRDFVIADIRTRISFCIQKAQATALLQSGIEASVLL